MLTSTLEDYYYFMILCIREERIGEKCSLEEKKKRSYKLVAK
jgi:hypothetical protein